MKRRVTSRKAFSTWVYGIAGPVLALLAFVITYLADPLNFSQQPLSALPAFMVSVVVLLISHHLSTTQEITKASIYSDRIYQAVKNYLHVTPIGSPEHAFAYIVGKLPELIEVKNTTLNIIDEVERADEKFYERKFFKDSQLAITRACVNGLLWKDIGDQLAAPRLREIYRRTTASLVPNEQSFYKFKLIGHQEPQLNFSILQFKDGATEVLFNWDYRGTGQDPTVLLSRDKHIVDMFHIHFAYLWRSAVADHDSTATKSSSVK